MKMNTLKKDIDIVKVAIHEMKKKEVIKTMCKERSQEMRKVRKMSINALESTLMSFNDDNAQSKED